MGQMGLWARQVQNLEPLRESAGTLLGNLVHVVKGGVELRSAKSGRKIHVRARPSHQDDP